MRYVLSTVFSLSALGKYGLHRYPFRIGGQGLPIAGTEHCTMRLAVLLSRSALGRYGSHWPYISFPYRWARPTDCRDFVMYSRAL